MISHITGVAPSCALVQYNNFQINTMIGVSVSLQYLNAEMIDDELVQ